MNKRNGFIVVNSTQECYYGVDRDVWPLQYFDPELNDALLSSLQMDRSESFIQRFDHALLYKQKANEVGVRADLLYCVFYDTEIDDYNEQLNGLAYSMRFLGWDYASEEGDFYSCILNDMSRHTSWFCDDASKLNQFGLFASEYDLNCFIAHRDKMKAKKPKQYFEYGPFSKVKVYAMDL